MSKKSGNSNRDAWHVFFKSVGITLACIGLIAVGFLGGMIITGAFG